MSLGLSGAYGNTAMAAGLRQRLMDQALAQKQQQDFLMQQRGADRADRALDQNDQFRQDTLAETARQHNLLATEKAYGSANQLGDQIPSGTTIGLNDPIVPLMQNTGHASLLQHADPNLASTEIGGMSTLPGPQPMQQGQLRMTPQPAQPERYIKQESEKQGQSRMAGEQKASDARDRAANQADVLAQRREAAARQAGVDTETGRHNRAMENRPHGGAEPKPRLVTSGDAGRISELDNSLAEADALSGVLGTTGAASKIGAWMPNVVTEMTGWGADAKSRQGTIDRVKQVIGKALEGGVLRKEDEIKYEKILPTIGDPPDVAKTKLAGLKTAIARKRALHLEALTEAGYDTSKFPAGEAAPAPKTPKRIVYDMNGNPVP